MWFIGIITSLVLCAILHKCNIRSQPQVGKQILETSESLLHIRGEGARVFSPRRQVQVQAGSKPMMMTVKKKQRGRRKTAKPSQWPTWDAPVADRHIGLQLDTAHTSISSSVSVYLTRDLKDETTFTRAPTIFTIKTNGRGHGSCGGTADGVMNRCWRTLSRKVVPTCVCVCAVRRTSVCAKWRSRLWLRCAWSPSWSLPGQMEETEVCR